MERSPSGNVAVTRVPGARDQRDGIEMQPSPRNMNNAASRTAICFTSSTSRSTSHRLNEIIL